MEINEVTGQLNISFVREVSATYRGPRRAKVKITGPACSAEFIRRVLPDNSREHFVTLYLDGANQVVAFSVTASGTASSCPVHPREVFQSAFLIGAIAVVVGHNHPSGLVTPSEEDKKIIQHLADSGAFLGLKVLDHVILSDDAFYSFVESDPGTLRPERATLARRHW